MTSAWVLRRVTACIGAWWQDKYLGSACRHVWRHMIIRFSGQVDQGMIRPSWQCVWLRSKLGVENLRWCVWEFQESLSVRGSAGGYHWDQVPGFWSWYAVGNVCLVGFIRQRLDVHKSDRERHGLLRLEDLDTAVSHGGCEMLWSLDLADKYVWLLMVVCTWESSLLARDVCLMPRTKFDSNTMLKKN